MANILVTGGKGTVGRLLVKELEKRSHRVISCDLMHSDNQRAYSLLNDSKDPTYVRCDISEMRQLERLFESFYPFDFVYNTAAEFGRWNGEDYYEQVWKTNAIGTKNIINCQVNSRFKLIHFSSSEVYGDWQGVMSENVMEENEVKQLNDYAISKWVNEMQIRNSISQHDLKTVVVRLFNTYGPGEYYSPYRSVNSRFIHCALNNLPWTVYKGHKRTSTYIDDTITTLANISDEGKFKSGKTYNIGGNRLHTIEELSDLIVEATGADPSLAHHHEKEEILTTKQKIVDISEAQRDLNHKLTVDLEEGIKKTVEWMKRVNDERR